MAVTPFTDSTYYKGGLYLPYSLPAEIAILDQAITKTEKKFLVAALGATLYDAFISGLGEIAPEQKWLNLLNGANFSVEMYGKTYSVKWNGLKNSEKESFLANFTYYQYVFDNAATYGSGGGVYSNNAENETQLPSRKKLMQVWNDALKLYGSLPAYGETSNEHGTYLVDCTMFNYDDNYMFLPSLFNFIYYTNLATPGTYPDWIFTGFKRQNELGI